MEDSTFVAKLSAALPDDLGWHERRFLLEKTANSQNPRIAARSALARWGKLDCHDYNMRYADVRKAEIDPLVHFVNFGLEEGRFMRLKGSRAWIGTRSSSGADQDGGQPTDDTLAVAYITDAKTLVPLFVSVFSLYLRHLHRIPCEVDIVAVDVEPEALFLLKSLETPDFQINLIFKNGELASFANLNLSTHVTTSALYKFTLADLLPWLGQVLYLDIDTVITGDISDLARARLNDCYVAAVEDVVANHVYVTPPAKRVNAPINFYFNSGVMALNLQMMRLAGASSALIAKRRELPGGFMDQDALNGILGIKAKYLEYEYNVMLNHVRSLPLQKLLDCTECKPASSKRALIKRARIVHFSGPRKPWDHPEDEFANIWHDYLYLLRKKLPNMPVPDYSSQHAEKRIKDYYYSNIGIDRFPAFHELYETAGEIIAKKYIELEFLVANEGKLPICPSPYKSPVIVTLTSTPERLPGIYPTIYSLVNQSLRPQAIWLWLATEEFQGSVEIPAAVKALQAYGLEIKFINTNLKSYKKLVPALAAAPDKIYATCDDDVFYERDWLKTLYAAHLADKNAICALRALKLELNDEGGIIEYESLNYADKTMTGMNLLSEGVGGVLYPPGCFHPDVLDKHKFMRLAPSADDLWFWAMGVLEGTRTRYVHTSMCGPVYRDIDLEMHGNTLWRTNVGQHANDKQLRNLFQAYPELSKIFI